MKIAFYAQHLTERGTSVITYDYALHNQQQLGNQSIVLYDKNAPGNDTEMIKRFAGTFELFPCDGWQSVDDALRRESCDLLYMAKAGKNDGAVSKVAPTLVHAVFAATVRHIHGASYAYVSDWLSDLTSGGRVPWVPHMIRVGDTDDDLRADLGIPAQARVFGCYGGKTSFDIDFARDVAIPQVLETQPDIYFLFMNITPFMDHPRVIFRPAEVDLEAKTAFINTCDAMLHARRRGETFGLAVGEFSLRNKPVLTYGRSKEQAHLRYLGDAALVYRAADDLVRLLSDFDKNTPSAQDTYRRLFSPAPVMQCFDTQLIQPAADGDFDGACKRFGLRRFDPSLLLRPKVKKLLNQL